MFAPINFLSHS